MEGTKIHIHWLDHIQNRKRIFQSSPKVWLRQPRIEFSAILSSELPKMLATPLTWSSSKYTWRRKNSTLDSLLLLRNHLDFEIWYLLKHWSLLWSSFEIVAGKFHPSVQLGWTCPFLSKMRIVAIKSLDNLSSTYHVIGFDFLLVIWVLKLNPVQNNRTIVTTIETFSFSNAGIVDRWRICLQKIIMTFMTIAKSFPLYPAKFFGERVLNFDFCLLLIWFTQNWNEKKMCT